MKPILLLFSTDDLVFGAFIAAFGYLVVFLVLVLLTYVFNAIPKVMRLNKIRKMKAEGREAEANLPEPDEDISGQETAAIAMTLYLFFDDSHDEEDMSMTIKRVSKTYSPWNSKLYGMNNTRQSR